MISEGFIKNYFNIHIERCKLIEKQVLDSFYKGFYENELINDFRVPKLAFVLRGYQIEEILEGLPFLRVDNDKKPLPIELPINNEISIKNNGDFDYKDLIIKPINKDYSWSKYGNFNIVMCNKNGYINGSHLIAEALKFENETRLKEKRETLPTGYYEFNRWYNLEETSVLFKRLCELLNVANNDLLFKVSGKQKKGEEMLQGYFLHTDLINSLVMWVSSTYAITINRIIWELNKNTVLKENFELKHKNKELMADNTEKSNIIVEVKTALNKAEETNNMIMQELKKLSQTNQNLFQNSIVISKQLQMTSQENKIISKQLNTTIKKNKVISKKLDTTLQINQVISNKLDTTNNYLQGIKNNVCVETYYTDVVAVIRIFDENDDTVCYKVVRTTEQYINRRINYYKKKYDENIEVIFNKTTPNGKSAAKRFLNENPEITNRSTTVYLNEGYLQGTFLNDLRNFLNIPVIEINNVSN